MMENIKFCYKSSQNVGWGSCYVVRLRLSCEFKVSISTVLCSVYSRKALTLLAKHLLILWTCAVTLNSIKVEFFANQCQTQNV